MKLKVIFILMLLTSLNSQGQDAVDSLNSIISGNAKLENKLDAYKEICNVLPSPSDAGEIGREGIELALSNNKYIHASYIAENIGYRMIFEVNADSAMLYFVLSCKYALKAEDYDQAMTLTNNIGYTHNYVGRPDSAIYYYEKALTYVSKAKDPEGEQANIYSNLGLIYLHKGVLNKALDYSIDAMKIRESMDDGVGLGMSYINVGGVYEHMTQNEEAYRYYKKGAEACEQAGDLNCELSAKSNMGTILFNKEQYEDALSLYESVYEKAKAANLKRVEANSLTNMGTALSSMKNHEKALDAYMKALKIRQEINHKIGLAESMNAIAKVYHIQGKHDEALTYFKKAKAAGEEVSNLRIVTRAVKGMVEHYAFIGNYKEAYNQHLEYVTLKDSVLNKENKEIVQTLEAKFKSAEKEKELALKEAELIKEQQARQKEQVIAERKDRDSKAQARQDELLRYAFAVGFILMAIIAIIAFRSYRSKQKANLLISEQRDVLNEKNKEILDSINYAKRIQTAILPPDKLVKEHLPNSFIIYKPKDIVAGDFYWLNTIKAQSGNDNLVLFAAADCTGHGVPGAMVSVICNSGLNRATREFGLSNPGQILDKTRELVIAEFEKSEEEVQDGMDIALCALEGNTLKYAGAHNPLWIIRNGAKEVEEIKAHKQPIGKYSNPQAFPTHEVSLNKGDSFYIFSDGFIDQFGGEKGKKFKSANFKQLLVSIQQEDMSKQQSLLHEAFETWRADFEQLDDVCVIGVRV